MRVGRSEASEARRTGSTSPGVEPAERNRSNGRPAGYAVTSSTSVFHVPQPSQRPAHFGCSSPHSVQRYTDRRLEDILLVRLLRREAVEPCALFVERELDGTRWAVTVLGEDEFGHSLLPLGILFK